MALGLQGGKGLGGFIAIVDHDAGGDGDAELGEDFFGLVFVEFHGLFGKRGEGKGGMVSGRKWSGGASDHCPHFGYHMGMKKAKSKEFSTPITLRTHLLARPDPIAMPPARVRAVRLGLGMSQEFFARCLRVSGRTLEKWEQGTSSATGAGAALLVLIEKHPELVTELALAR